MEAKKINQIVAGGLGLFLVLGLAGVGFERALAASPTGIQWQADRSEIEGEATRPTYRAAFYNLNSFGAGPDTALIDLELYDFDGNKVAQAFFDNQTINPAVTREYSLTPSQDLSPGQYRFAVGVFDPGWGSLRQWHNAAALVTVGDVASGEVKIVNHGQNWVELQAVGDEGFTGVIDLELYGSGGTAKISQKFWEAERLQPGAVRRYELSPLFLTPADQPYVLKAGVFTPFWEELVVWYDQVESFSVVN